MNSDGTGMRKNQTAVDQHGCRQFINKSQVKTQKYYTVQNASILWKYHNLGNSGTKLVVKMEVS